MAVYFDTASYGPLALRLTGEACGSGCLVFGSDAPVMDAHAAVAAVEAAGVAEVALRTNAGRLFGVTPTPLEEATLAGRRLLLKREDVHPLGAFKWRGALPVLERYAADGARAVVTASTGNHGAATAWAARARRPRRDRVRTGNGQLGEARAYRR